MESKKADTLLMKEEGMRFLVYVGTCMCEGKYIEKKSPDLIKSKVYW